MNGVCRKLRNTDTRRGENGVAIGMNHDKKFKPALAHRWLTNLYDPLLQIVLKRYNFLERLTADAAIRSGDNVLDVGCGTGRLCIAVKKKQPQCHIVGLDADAEILRVAERNIKEAGCEVELVRGSSAAMPFPTNTFDRVLSSLLFHHLTTSAKRRTLREIRRVLKPGGTVHILDWGKPTNLLLRLAFLPVQLFDGFDTTADNVKGLIPTYMEEAHFQDVAEVTKIPTPGGSLSLYRGIKAG